ncbi:MAG: hypothetical protein HQL53_11930, partial [Magnetococcales bacterium]|nr:hypothetical protein [Magnetococcales bacterium]
GFITATALALVLNRVGIPVVLGGIHISAVPEDVDRFIRNYVPDPDRVVHVVGPADSQVVDTLLQDLNGGTLKRTYTGVTTIEDGVWGAQNVNKLPKAAPEGIFSWLPLIGKHLNTQAQVNSTTPFLGCPYSCSFCSISSLQEDQRRLTKRTPADFVAELASYQKGGITFRNRFFYFLPDNLLLGGGDLEATLDAIIESDLRVNYSAQISIDVAHRPDLRKKLRQSGATQLFIGFESLILEDLQAIGKTFLIKRIQKSGLNVRAYYAQAIKTLQAEGFSICGAFIFGLPGNYFHDLEHHTGRDVADFCNEHHLSLQATVLADLPGSLDFKQRHDSGSPSHQQQNPMDYFLSLNSCDLTESNKQDIPPALHGSPLIATYLAYDATLRVADGYRPMAPFFTGWRAPKGGGRWGVWERLVDGFAAYGFQKAFVDQYAYCYNSVVRSNNKVRGSFERLLAAEKNPQVRSLFQPVIDQLDSGKR